MEFFVILSVKNSTCYSRSWDLTRLPCPVHHNKMPSENNGENIVICTWSIYLDHQAEYASKHMNSAAINDTNATNKIFYYMITVQKRSNSNPTRELQKYEREMKSIGEKDK